MLAITRRRRRQIPACGRSITKSGVTILSICANNRRAKEAAAAATKSSSSSSDSQALPASSSTVVPRPTIKLPLVSSSRSLYPVDWWSLDSPLFNAAMSFHFLVALLSLSKHVRFKPIVPISNTQAAARALRDRTNPVVCIQN